MNSLYLLLLLIAFSQSATVVPLQSSHVDVRQSGAEFSYNIQENRGVATIEEHHIPVAAPLINAVHVAERLSDQVKEKHEEHHQEQIVHVQKAEARANLDLKELKKSEAIITQPLLLSPYEYYAYYYPYSTYSLPSLPKSSYVSYLPTAHGIPYPYTLYRTA